MENDALWKGTADYWSQPVCVISHRKLFFEFRFIGMHIRLLKVLSDLCARTRAVAINIRTLNNKS